MTRASPPMPPATNSRPSGANARWPRQFLLSTRKTPAGPMTRWERLRRPEGLVAQTRWLFTLLMLVSAFAGTAFLRQAYDEAVRMRYRFYSYGDAMLITTRQRLVGS